MSKAKLSKDELVALARKAFLLAISDFGGHFPDLEAINIDTGRESCTCKWKTPDLEIEGSFHITDGDDCGSVCIARVTNKKCGILDSKFPHIWSHFDVISKRYDQELELKEKAFDESWMDEDYDPYCNPLDY
ncbi:hypothetical protein ACFL2R_04370 [Patescibacteria group bacterium]